MPNKKQPKKRNDKKVTPFFLLENDRRFIKVKGKLTDSK